LGCESGPEGLGFDAPLALGKLEKMRVARARGGGRALFSGTPRMFGS